MTQIVIQENIRERGAFRLAKSNKRGPYIVGQCDDISVKFEPFAFNFNYFVCMLHDRVSIIDLDHIDTINVRIEGFCSGSLSFVAARREIKLCIFQHSGAVLVMRAHDPNTQKKSLI